MVTVAIRFDGEHGFWIGEVEVRTPTGPESDFVLTDRWGKTVAAEHPQKPPFELTLRTAGASFPCCDERGELTGSFPPATSQGVESPPEGREGEEPIRQAVVDHLLEPRWANNAREIDQSTSQARDGNPFVPPLVVFREHRTMDTYLIEDDSASAGDGDFHFAFRSRQRPETRSGGVRGDSTRARGEACGCHLLIPAHS